MNTILIPQRSLDATHIQWERTFSRYLKRFEGQTRRDVWSVGALRFNRWMGRQWHRQFSDPENPFHAPA